MFLISLAAFLVLYHFCHFVKIFLYLDGSTFFKTCFSVGELYKFLI